MPTPVLSIIIPVFNAEKSIVKLLNSIMLSNYKDYEIIVIDDGSSDGTRKIVKDFPIKIMHLKKNVGPAVARNIGARNARGEILAFIDSDVILEENTLKASLGKFAKFPNLDFVNIITSFEPANRGLLPRFSAFLLEYQNQMALKSLGKNRGEILFWGRYFNTRCGLIKREAFDRTGGFNELYRKPSIEDFDFARRLDKGMLGLIDPGITISHHFPSSLPKLFRQYFINASLWASLFIKSKQFEKVFGTPRESIKAILTFLSFSSVILYFIFKLGIFIYSFIILIILFLTFNFGFMKVCLKQGGTKFTILSTGLYYLRSIAIAMGGAWGFLKFMLRKE